ncbi:divalent-cation tolerance protein CutA [Geminisphaera colitermitum]|uniref:divalent-cation tolerance protein CutA n=1 Tax=Geminisphaera colitermitum TaxID=1148786 RepID=UPI000158C533|nr:divalent-cation tolerance protein CutA [Geminisphaera colitermitum]
MLIAWTTLENEADAQRLAAESIRLGLAACVQVEGPITSHYRWEGGQQQSAEYRLCFKFLPGQQPRLEAWLHEHHPYETPEWVVVAAAHVGEKYLSWAMANSSS